MAPCLKLWPGFGVVGDHSPNFRVPKIPGHYLRSPRNCHIGPHYLLMVHFWNCHPVPRAGVSCKGTQQPRGFLSHNMKSSSFRDWVSGTRSKINMIGGQQADRASLAYDFVDELSHLRASLTIHQAGVFVEIGRAHV